MNRFQHQHIDGAGIGLRSNHYQHLLTCDARRCRTLIEGLPDVPWLELLTDNYLANGGQPLDYLQGIREPYPVHTIRQHNQPDWRARPGCDERIDLASGGVDLLVWRNGTEMRLDLLERLYDDITLDQLHQRLATGDCGQQGPPRHGTARAGSMAGLRCPQSGWARAGRPTSTLKQADPHPGNDNWTPRWYGASICSSSLPKMHDHGSPPIKDPGRPDRLR